MVDLFGLETSVSKNCVTHIPLGSSYQLSTPLALPAAKNLCLSVVSFTPGGAADDFEDSGLQVQALAFFDVNKGR